MKTTMRTLARDEKGAALLLAIILLLVGGLIAAPLLAHMGTGILTGEVYETRTAELYAADAGVEDAIWRIQTNNLAFDAGNYSHLGPLAVNNRSVDVVVYRYDWDLTCGENLTYRILSTATSQDGSSTAIKSYVDAEIVVRNLFDNAITSQGNINLGSNSVVNGNVQYGGSLTGGEAVNGTKTAEAYANWPDSTTLSNYYRSQVQSKNATDPGDKIRIDQLNPKTIGPSYRHGSLHIDNKGTPATLTLNGTVYVDGDLAFDQPGASSNYTINLNGQTIFATGSITFPSAGAEKAKVSITGSGCIIAIGRIDFWPSISGSPSDFVFVMSTGSYVDFKPGGDFYGSLAGDVRVDLASKCTMTWTSWRGRGINFPIEDYAYATNKVKTLAVRSWEVNPQ